MNYYHYMNVLEFECKKMKYFSIGSSFHIRITNPSILLVCVIYRVGLPIIVLSTEEVTIIVLEIIWFWYCKPALCAPNILNHSFCVVKEDFYSLVYSIICDQDDLIGIIIRMKNVVWVTITNLPSFDASFLANWDDQI